MEKKVTIILSVLVVVILLLVGYIVFDKLSDKDDETEDDSSSSNNQNTNQQNNKIVNNDDSGSDNSNQNNNQESSSESVSEEVKDAKDKLSEVVYTVEKIEDVVELAEDAYNDYISVEDESEGTINLTEIYGTDNVSEITENMSFVELQGTLRILVDTAMRYVDNLEERFQNSFLTGYYKDTLLEKVQGLRDRLNQFKQNIDNAKTKGELEDSFVEFINFQDDIKKVNKENKKLFFLEFVDKILGFAEKIVDNIEFVVPIFHKECNIFELSKLDDTMKPLKTEISSIREIIKQNNTDGMIDHIHNIRDMSKGIVTDTKEVIDNC